jgi:flagellin-like protein
MKKRVLKINEKGVSPVIATVLLVLIVIIIAVIILIWYTAFQGEVILKEVAGVKKRAELYCMQVKLDPINNPDGSLGIKNQGGSIPIYGYKLLLTEEGKGKTKTEVFKGKEYAINPGGAKMLEITGSYDEVKLIPILLGKPQGKDSVQEFLCPEANAIKIK